MTISENVKVFPKSEFRVLLVSDGSTFSETGEPLHLSRLSLPHPKDEHSCTFLVDEKNKCLYELKKVNFYNPHLPVSKRPITTTKGECLNSLIVETVGSEDGMVIEEPEIFVASKFNLVYMLLAFFEQNIKNLAYDADTSTGSRFISFEDMSERLLDDTDSPLKDLPACFFEQDTIGRAFELLCDTMGEPDDLYYKLSLQKVISFLRSRVERICEKFPESIMDSILKSKINAPSGKSEELDPETVRCCQKIYAIQLLGSYLSDFYVEQVSVCFRDDLNRGKDHLAKMASLHQEQRMAQQGIDELSASLSSTNGSKKRKPVVQQKKVPVKKIAVGRGALDGFFKRA
ncbi:unnamed protein product [Kuraishia capsulata CBS 1993]|uniref:Ribonuclease H2 subunit B n=1 Tax=Kuraishia capsulata CBS 1993 TaxID=1382522 RepID=W6MXX6_9ASCO|nr:uncharacterized protein KUCA_T00005643001 [Kuraishia capsulata CBS 1993]CDK29650.1 unnamed protein product [Kuraishia capsulata CBS 1993]